MSESNTDHERLISREGLHRLMPESLKRGPGSASRRVRARLGLNGGGIRALSDLTITPRIETVAGILSVLPAGRLLDLGSGHGVFARTALAMGWEVTAQDVRATRFPAQSGGIRWLTGDVLDLRVEPGEYDLILCLGLFYHLELEGQLALLRGISHTALLLDTHTTNEGVPQSHGDQLTDVVEVGGYRGRYYREVDGADGQARRAVPTASWDNESSFWATSESLLQMLRDSGYGHVLDHTAPKVPGRTFQLCIPARPILQVIDRGSVRRGVTREAAAVVVSAARRAGAEK